MTQSPAFAKEMISGDTDKGSNLTLKIKNMAKKLGYGKREETSKIHQKIVNEFEEMKIKNNGKNIKISLDFLAKKYGYSCGQAVRNMINNFHKKSK